MHYLTLLRPLKVHLSVQVVSVFFGLWLVVGPFLFGSRDAFGQDSRGGANFGSEPALDKDLGFTGEDPADLDRFKDKSANPQPFPDLPSDLLKDPSEKRSVLPGGDTSLFAEPTVTPEVPQAQTVIQRLLERSTKGPKGKNDMIIYRAVMENLAFRRDNSLLHRASLETSLESLLASICMPNIFKDLAYPGPPSNPDCIELISFTLGIDSDNPVAICARDGIFSPTCREAYNRQEIEEIGTSVDSLPSAENLAGDKKGTKLDFDALNSKNNLRISDLNQELDKIEQKLAEFRLAQVTPPAKESPVPRSTPSAQELAQYNGRAYKLYSDLLALQCGSAKVKLIDTENKEMGSELLQASPTPTLGFGATGNVNEEYEAMSGQLGNPTPEPKAAQLPKVALKRVRLLSSSCMMMIRRARGFDPQFASARCHEVGFTSPQCLESVIAARKKSEALKTGASGTVTAPGQTKEKPSLLAF